MYNIKVKIKGILVLMVFAICAISCSTLVDSATAVAIEAYHDVSDEKIVSASGDPLETKSSFSASPDKTSKNSKEDLKRTPVNTKDKSSQTNDKKDKKASTTVTGNTNKKIAVVSANTEKTVENVTNTSTKNENTVAAASNQKVEPINNNFGFETQAIGLILVSILCIISFSSFILYLRS